jgi:hypothetical protein
MGDASNGWILGAGAMLCSAAAGLVFSFSVPTWQGDERLERLTFADRWRHHHGAEEHGLAVLGCLLSMVGTPSRSGLLCLVFLAAALALGWNAWPPDMLMQGVNDGSADSGGAFLLMLLLIGGTAGYVAGQVWQERALPRIMPRTDFDGF